MNQLAARRPCVLLVDDCGDQRDLYALLLNSEFEIVSVSRGAEAIAIAVARGPDVIVLDVQMPGLDGLETCRRLKADPTTASIPVILLTGSDFVVADAQLAGAFAVLHKPCPERTLVEAITTAIAEEAR